jgi:hypothetical protein
MIEPWSLLTLPAGADTSHLVLDQPPDYRRVEFSSGIFLAIYICF